MKRYISYFAVLLAVLLGAACSKDDSAAGSDNRTGVMAMTVSTRQTADTGEYDPLQHQTVYIYNDEGGLLRKYTSKEACPERLELLAGTYRVAVEAGEEAPADFTKRLYKGEETFTVKPAETTNVAVVCQIVNTVVEVKFDDTIAENLAPGYSVWIAGGEKVDEEAAEAGSVPALRFTAEGTGYYTLPAGMTSLAWLFRGTHVESKNVEMEDYIPNVKAGGQVYPHVQIFARSARLYRLRADQRRPRYRRQGRRNHLQPRSGRHSEGFDTPKSRSTDPERRNTGSWPSRN